LIQNDERRKKKKFREKEKSDWPEIRTNA